MKVQREGTRRDGCRRLAALVLTILLYSVPLDVYANEPKLFELVHELDQGVAISKIAISADGELVAAATAQSIRLSIWRWRQGQLVARHDAARDVAARTSIAFAANGKTLYSATAYARWKGNVPAFGALDIATNRWTYGVGVYTQREDAFWNRCLDVLAVGDDLLCVMGGRQFSSVLYAPTLEVVRVILLPGFATDMRVDPGTRTVIAKLRGDSVRAIDVDSGHLGGPTMLAFKNRSMSFDITPDGSRIVVSATQSGASQGRVLELGVWRRDNNVEEYSFPDLDHAPKTTIIRPNVRVSPDGRFVAWIHATTLVINRWDTLQSKPTTIKTPRNEVEDFAFAPDGEHLFVADGSKLLILRRTPTPQAN